MGGHEDSVTEAVAGLSLSSTGRAEELPPKPPQDPPNPPPPSEEGQATAEKGGPGENKGTTGQERQEAGVKAAGEKLCVKDFEFGSKLGEGSYSRVLRATNVCTGTVVAVKIVEKALVIKEKKTKHVGMEKDCLNMCRHAGIVRLYATFQDPQRLYFVMEACPRDLFDLLKEVVTFSEACARFFAAQLVEVLEYIHSKGVIHRDFKPENLLVSSSGHLKLTDFGTAAILKDGSGRSRTFVGTAEYVSPEVLEDRGACQSSDLWALGCTLFQFLAGRVPFRGGSEYLTFQMIVGLEYSFPGEFPPICRDLVGSLLVADPAGRLGADGEGNANQYGLLREHAFFAGVEWVDPPLHQQTPPPVEPFLTGA